MDTVLRHAKKMVVVTDAAINGNGIYSFLQSRCVLCAEGIGDCKCFICDFNYPGIVEKQIQSMYGDRKCVLLFS